MLFNKKLRLIEKHLQEPTHPLKILRKQFSKDLYKKYIWNYTKNSNSQTIINNEMKSSSQLNENNNNMSVLEKNENYKALFNQIVDNVLKFKEIFKRVLVQMYELERLRGSQQDKVSTLINEFILDTNVSDLLIKAATKYKQKEILLLH